MKHCETCKWYKIPEKWGHICTCPKISYGYKTPDYRGDDRLVVEDDVGWGMIPGPKFGCIHHNN